MTPYKTMKFTDENGNEFEAMDVDWDKCPPETVLYALKPIKKPKWSVETVYWSYEERTVSDLKVSFGGPILPQEAEAIKAFIEASLEYIYATESEIDSHYLDEKLSKAQKEAVEAIEDKDG